VLDLGFRDQDWLRFRFRDEEPLVLDLRLLDGGQIVMETGSRYTLALKMETGPGCVRFGASRWRLDCVLFWLSDEDQLALDVRLQDGGRIVMEIGLRYTFAFEMATGLGCVRFGVTLWRLDCVSFRVSRLGSVGVGSSVARWGPDCYGD
jgi:hypothetical protein